MTQEEYEKLKSEIPSVELVRPYGIDKSYHKDRWGNLTVLICQRQTKDLIQLTLESLLRFYPDLNILVVDGDSQDDSTLYLQYMAKKYNNISLWERKGMRHSHGETLDQAIREYIKTPYVLIMDSDVITERSGHIEGMMKQFEDDPKLYATGVRMLVSRENEACDAPHRIDDVLQYAHISTAIFHVPTYLTLKRFVDHGACACHNMIDAESKGYHIGYFPVDKYNSHLSGGSWCVPRTIWRHDFDTPIRPFITFIVTLESQVAELRNQSDHDFDILTLGKFTEQQFVIHGAEPFNVTNYLYDLRFKVHGEYVCYLNESINTLDVDFVRSIKLAAIENDVPNELIVGGVFVVERKEWQHKYSMR